jgi:hypothetical protein
VVEKVDINDSSKKIREIAEEIVKRTKIWRKLKTNPEAARIEIINYAKDLKEKVDKLDKIIEKEYSTG